ncbi:MAG: TonB-dependent receptor [Pseudomonadota bacterium]
MIFSKIMAQMTFAVVLAVLLPTFADAQQAMTIDVPAQDLSSALNELSEETALQISARTALVDGRTSTSVRGDMTPLAALETLLIGTGLGLKPLGSDGAIVVPLDLVSQNTVGQGPLVMDQIVIQGELLDRTVQDTQTSVAVITGDELEQRGDSTLGQVIERTPGVSVGEGVDFTIRGINGRSITGFGGGGALVTTTVDGARISNFVRRDTTTFSTWDLEQIEVLRGPQSTQSGRNALAGAVIVESKNPTYDQEFKLRTGAGNFGTFVGAFAANMPVADETLSFRVSGEVERTRGFVDNVTLGTDDAGKAVRQTFRANMLFEPTDDFSALVKLNFSETDLGQLLFPISTVRDRVTLNDVVEREETRLRSASVRLSYDITEAFSIQSDTNLFDRRLDSISDTDSGAFPVGADILSGDADSVEQELKLLYQDGETRAVIGGFYTRTNEAETALIADGTIGTFEEDRDNENFAVFGEAEVEVVNDIRLIAGIRYDRETLVGFSSFSFGGVEQTSATDSTFDAFLPKGGIVYDLSDDMSLGFTFQRGYRAGGSTVNPFSGLVEFDPEFTNNYELSFRSEWLDGDLTVNANAFYTKWTDQQVVLIGSNGGPANLDFETVNAGESRLFGGELDIRARPMPGLEVFAGLGYADTEFLDFVTNGEQLAGNEFVTAPKWTAAVGGTYTFEEGFFLGADASYASDSFGDVQNTLGLDARFLVNMRAGYETDFWRIFAYADNVFDNEYLLASFSNGRSRVGDPMTFGVIGQIQF